MALSADYIRHYEEGPINSLQVAASSIIYRGSAIGLSSGYARALNAGDKFAGFAEQGCDNSAGGGNSDLNSMIVGTGSAGSVSVAVLDKGEVYVDTLSNLTVANIGNPVFMSDDTTFTLTETGNSFVGWITRVDSATTCMVEFDAQNGATDVVLHNLATNISPSHVVKYAGSANFAGGAASGTITVTGALTTDVLQVNLNSKTNDTYLESAIISSANTITLTFKADPGATVIGYTVLRATAD